MKKLSMLFIALLMLLTLAGCSQKEFSDKKISFKGASTLDFYVGEQKSVTALLPDNGVETTLTVKSNDSALTAVLSDDGILTMTGDTAGSYKLSLTLSAKGYADCSVDYPVNVKLREQKVAIKAGGSSVSDKISFVFGDEPTISVKSSAENAEITVSASDENGLSVSGEGPFTLRAAASGEFYLTISVTADGFEPFSQKIPVIIEKKAVEFSLSADSVSGNIGSNLTVKANYTDGLSLSARCDDSAVSVKTQGDNIIVSSNTAGSYEIAVICSAENYLSVERRFTAVFTKPSADFSVAQSISVESGSSITLSISNFSQGTAFSLNSTPKVTAVLSGNRITVTGNAAGAAEISVTSSRDGYQSVTKIISVTITSPQVSTTSKYDSVILDVIKYTNQERAKYGLNQLEYLSDIAACCQVRAKEASVRWAHERPDDRSFETVFYDMGFLDYYAAGENLLMCGYLDGERAVSDWMDSPGHRENILRTGYDAICVGIYYDSSTGYYYYAQHFIDRWA